MIPGKGVSSIGLVRTVVVFVLFSSLFILTTMFWWNYRLRATDQVIHEDVVKLVTIFNKIQKECQITGFEHLKNHIDFLNVISFSGSQVGSMNLANPTAWQGPYLTKNPTVQEKMYAILKTKQGYFIVPGDGVRLSNGKIIGKDIVFHEKTDMYKLLKSSQALLSKSGVLAAPIRIVSDELSSMIQQPDFLLSID